MLRRMTAIAPFALAAPVFASPVPQLERSHSLERLGSVQATMPDGSAREVELQRRWRPFCINGHDVMLGDLDELRKRIENRGPQVGTVTRSARGAGGMNLVWNIFGDTSPEAEAGLQATSDFYAERFRDDVTITINVNFDPGFFGGAGPASIFLDYEDLRLAMLADADPDDTIQSQLPANDFPALRTFGGSVTQEDMIELTTANARALGISVGAGVVDADIFIGSELDFMPENGISSPGQWGDYSGMDILIHEVGHVLGFVNFIEFGGAEPTALDLFRFPEGGPGDPDTTAEFAGFPRALYIGSSSSAQQHQFDDIELEAPLSNASDFQASHFRETNFGDPDAPRVGVMEPAITVFETRFPEYMSQADFNAFDAIGWDIFDACSPADFAEPFGTLDFSDVIAFLAAFSAMDASADFALPAGVFDFSDVIAFLGAFASGCP